MPVTRLGNLEKSTCEAHFPKTPKPSTTTSCHLRCTYKWIIADTTIARLHIDVAAARESENGLPNRWWHAFERIDRVGRNKEEVFLKVTVDIGGVTSEATKSQEHRCAIPGCSFCIVIDGNAKNHRQVCGVKEGTIEFPGLPGSIKTEEKPNTEKLKRDLNVLRSNKHDTCLRQLLDSSTDMASEGDDRDQVPQLTSEELRVYFVKNDVLGLPDTDKTAAMVALAQYGVSIKECAGTLVDRAAGYAAGYEPTRVRIADGHMLTAQTDIGINWSQTRQLRKPYMTGPVAPEPQVTGRAARYAAGYESSTG
uniref:Uncharacterized protein n=1 Tax=Branchiostoma floridae TaxID=7739 RepID=C3ZW66_BRAFL|eukprot:XP_002587186.1 hypothetical protein BRAFLDRAFT_102071 [Branchiostoma floridae]